MQLQLIKQNVPETTGYFHVQLLTFVEFPPK